MNKEMFQKGNSHDILKYLPFELTVTNIKTYVFILVTVNSMKIIDGCLDRQGNCGNTIISRR